MSIPPPPPPPPPPDPTGLPSPYAPPQTDSEAKFTYLGRTMSEAEFLTARRHNVYRWIVSSVLMIIGLLVIILLIPGTILKIMALGGAGSGIYFLTSEMFPGSKVHGSAIYKKYELHRDIQIMRRERERRAAS